jgi:isopenicillin-N epimerase
MTKSASAAELKRHWGLDPEIVQLNHGSFGACPRAVLARQRALREQLEREPSRFFNLEAAPLLAESRAELGGFIGCGADDLAFVPNVTAALNGVLGSLRLEPDDEVLVTNQEYNATRNIVEYTAARDGHGMAVAELPYPAASPDAVLEAILERVGPATRLVVIDHVTSQTGLVLPVERLIPALAERGVEVLVDGAHAPGMLDLDVSALAPAYYTGNCHKWICAPKGAGFLYVRRDLQDGVRPSNISHGANAGLRGAERFRAEFDWTGTGDPTAQIAVGDAIRFMGGLLPGGWPEVRARNRALCLEGRRIVADALGVTPPCPDEMIGSLATLPVPGSERFPLQRVASALEPDALHQALFEQYAIEVPILTSLAHSGRLIRISAQLYNERSDYERLGEALRELLGR